MFHRSRKSFQRAVIAGAFACIAHPANALLYAIDDGTIGGTLSNGSPSTFANQFTVIAGGQTISNIGIAWALIPNGTPLLAKLWSDPNGDGNPSDAVVLSSIPGVVSSSLPASTPSGTAVTFAIYDIPDVVLLVGQSFFVGATMPAPPIPSEVAFDLNPPNHGQGWGVHALDFLGSTPLHFTGSDFLVRANVPSAAAVAEPATLGLLALALGALGMSRKGRKR
jgi:hypothetical protein